MADEADLASDREEAFRDAALERLRRPVPRRFKPLSNICEGCGEEIPAKRIEAMPGTNLCVECAE